MVGVVGCRVTGGLLLQVGLYKMHPDIPEELSEKARSFILRCFEPDPNKRATATQLLEDPFLAEYVQHLCCLCGRKMKKLLLQPSLL